MVGARGNGAPRRNNRRRAGSAFGGHENGKIKPMDLALGPAELAGLGVERVPFSLQFFKEEVYVMLIERKVLRFGEVETETHWFVLGLNLAKVDAAQEIALRLLEALQLPRVIEHIEIMGRESTTFESVVRTEDCVMVYFDGPFSEGFGALARRSAYRARLLELVPLRDLRPHRAWEVRPDPDALQDEDAPKVNFVLDTGTDVYHFVSGRGGQLRGRNNPLFMLTAEMLQRNRESTIQKRTQVDDFFWQRLRASAAATTGAEETATMSPSAASAGLDAPASTSLLFRVVQSDSDAFEFHVLREGRFSPIHMDNDDSIYLVDDSGREVFVYRREKLDFSLLVQVSRAYFEMDSGSLPRPVTLVCEDITPQEYDDAFKGY